ncbi:MAG: aldehyde ferredoxin oxidoreductase C-terminal domain-containing protein [Chloroflexota bacterium]
MAQNKPAYAPKMLRADLTNKKLTDEVLDPEMVKRYIGGTGFGARILYDEVVPGVEWAHPENRLILATGPLGGTRMNGSGTFSVVTKGPLTNGGTASQANGFWGAFIRFNGYIGVVVQGASDRWVYLYIHDGKAELKDARHLVGKDTWETEDAIKKDLGYAERAMSVFCIGPAGENLVKVAGIIGDKGHAAPHNGTGAVMGSKRLKAIAVARGKAEVPLYDKDALSALAEQMHNNLASTPQGQTSLAWGTSMLFPGMVSVGTLPIKNLRTNLFQNVAPWLGENYRKKFDLKPSPCWACPSHHLHIMTVKEGPYAGYVGEEPEYECWSELGPLIGNDDINGAFVLSNEIDKLGFDVNEMGYLLSFVIDIYERGIISKEDTGGLEMTWGNVEAARQLLHKIATREGFGNLLAEGLKRAAEQIGGEALKYAAYIQKGHGPRGHDHRGRWTEILDYATSSAGTIETGPIGGVPPEFKLPAFTDPFNPDQVALQVAKFKPRRQFIDLLGLCMQQVGPDYNLLLKAVNAATGWNITVEDTFTTVYRHVNLLRAFNLRHGVSLAVEAPSILYSSVPVDGPAKGKDIKPVWNHMLDEYYKHMGWDRKTGRPFPETLKKLGLEKESRDLWGG